MKTARPSSLQAGIVLVVAVLVPVLLIAGASGQLGFFILVSTSFLQVVVVSEVGRRLSFAPPVILQPLCLNELFDRPPPASR